MSKDISNRAVLILAVLTIVISVLGTFTVLSATHAQGAAVVPTSEDVSSTSSGVISLRITQPENSPATTGQVTLGIQTEN